MLTVLIRTLIVYTLLSLMLRLMGKRQIGELEIEELVSTLLLSEIATMPIDDPNIPLLFALIPILLIVALELLTSDLKNRLPILKRIFEGKPSILIAEGRLDQKELRRMRISVEELFSAFRLQGVADISDVRYAILEQNGQLSVIPNAEKQPLTPSSLGVETTEGGISHLLVVDGAVNRGELATVGKSEEWLAGICRAYGCERKDIFLLSADDAGKITLIPRAKSRKTTRSKGGNI